MVLTPMIRVLSVVETNSNALRVQQPHHCQPQRPVAQFEKVVSITGLFVSTIDPLDAVVLCQIY
jgi:hypothetical protein